MKFNNVCIAVIALSPMLAAACMDLADDADVAHIDVADIADDIDDAELSSTSQAVETEVPDDPSFDSLDVAAASDCPPGWICFFTGRNFTGRMCRWRGQDKDWAAGDARCSWALTSNVCSIFNRTPHRMEYFRLRHFTASSRIGSTLPNVGGNLSCSYRLRSHRPM